MKLVKIVKLQRVQYVDLDEGDWWDDPLTQARILHEAGDEMIPPDSAVIVTDTDKYPPEVTYNIEGIPEERIRPLVGVVGATSMRLFIPHMDESEIETRYV